MRNLESIVKTIQETKKVAEKKFHEAPASAQTAVRGQIQRAKLDLEQLYRDYRKALQNRVIFILVTGSQTDKFVQMAENDFECFSVDAESFYSNILDQVPTRYFNQTSSPALFEYFAAKFEDRALDIEIVGYPPLLFEQKYKKQLKGRDDVHELMKRAFNEKVGGEVVGLDAIDRVAEKAVNSEFSGKMCPIILHTKDPQLVRELEKDIKRAVTSNVFVVTTGAKVDKLVKDVALSNVKSINKSAVEKALLKVRESVK